MIETFMSFPLWERLALLIALMVVLAVVLLCYSASFMEPREALPAPAPSEPVLELAKQLDELVRNRCLAEDFRIGELREAIELHEEELKFWRRSVGIQSVQERTKIYHSIMECKRELEMLERRAEPYPNDRRHNSRAKVDM